MNNKTKRNKRRTRKLSRKLSRKPSRKLSKRVNKTNRRIKKTNRKKMKHRRHKGGGVLSYAKNKTVSGLTAIRSVLPGVVRVRPSMFGNEVIRCPHCDEIAGFNVYNKVGIGKFLWCANKTCGAVLGMSSP